MHTRAFSVVELLVTLAILAVMIGVGQAVYTNLHEQAEETVHNRDQRVMKQLIDSFRMTGGDMAMVTALPETSATERSIKAWALTKIMQQSASAAARKQRGQIGGLIASDMLLVPYSAADGRTRLVTKTNPLRLELTTDGVDGFAVVKNDTILGKQVAANYAHFDASADSLVGDAKLAVNAALDPTLTGSRFADATAGIRDASAMYIWNEDTTIVAVPTGAGSTTSGGSTSIPGSIPLIVKPAGTDRFTFYQYENSDPTMDFYVYRADGKQLFLDDALASFSSNNAPITPLSGPAAAVVPSSLTGSLGIVHGLRYTVRLNDSGFSYYIKYPNFATDDTIFRTLPPDAERFNINAVAAATPPGRLGHIGMAGLASAPSSNSTTITVTRPTKLRVAYYFNNTRWPGDNQTAVMPGSEDAVDFVYHNYQFGAHYPDGTRPDGTSTGVDASGNIIPYLQPTECSVLVYRDDQFGQALEASDIAAPAVQWASASIDLLNHVSATRTIDAAQARGILYNFDMVRVGMAGGAGGQGSPDVLSQQGTAAYGGPLKLAVTHLRPSADAIIGSVDGPPETWKPSIIDIDYGVDPDNAVLGQIVKVNITANPATLAMTAARPQPTLQWNYLQYVGNTQQLTISRNDHQPVTMCDVNFAAQTFGDDDTNIDVGSGLAWSASGLNIRTVGFTFDSIFPAKDWSTSNAKSLQVVFSPSQGRLIDGIPTGGKYGDATKEGIQDVQPAYSWSQNVLPQALALNRPIISASVPEPIGPGGTITIASDGMIPGTSTPLPSWVASVHYVEPPMLASGTPYTDVFIETGNYILLHR